jgi:hypothetical protein
MLSSWQLTYLFLGLFALPGLFVLAYGLREGLVGYRLHAVDPTPVADLANVSGPVEVSGTARTHDGTVEAPLTGTPCLAYEWAVEERRRDGDGDGTWTTIASGGSSIPFRADDGVASVLVDPTDADLRLAEAREIGVGTGEAPPDAVRAFLEREPDVAPEYREFRLGPFDLSSGNARRYRESRLDPGEPVYVYGRSTYAPGTSREAGQVNARIGCGKPFVVADGTEAEATRRVLGRAAGFVAFGLLWLGFVAGIVLFG